MFKRASLILCGSLIVVACAVAPSNNFDGGTDASTSDVASDVITNNDASTGVGCAGYVAARCMKADSCSQNIANQVNYGSETTCETRQMLACVAALAAADTSATTGFFTACAAAIQSETCDDFENANIPSACIAAPGTIANGTACTFDAQCTSTWCQITAGAACGTCETLPVAGATCAVTADCGGRGMLCAANKCVARGALNATCDAANPCGFALTCVGTTAKTCQQSGTSVGASCDPQHQTGPGCVGQYALTCVEDGLCTRDTLSPTGSCGVIDIEAGLDAEAPSSNTECTLGGLCAAGTCALPAADNAACDDTNGPPCLAPARCVTTSDASTAGTCTLPSGTTCQ